MKHPILPLVFVTGAAVLAMEVAATRLLAPSFGTTVFAVSGVISVVLGALSLGYYLGGRWADQHASPRLFYALIFCGGVSVLFIQLGLSWFVPVISGLFGLLLGPLMASLALFFVPSLLLGALSPLAVVLYQRQAGHLGTGRAAGGVSFWSTTGSIAGSLATAFVFIPRVGLSVLIVGIGLGLVTIGLVGLLVTGVPKAGHLVMALLVPAVLVGVAVDEGMMARNVHYLRDGSYGRIAIFDGEYLGRPARFLKIDDSNSGARFLDGDDLMYEYTRYAELFRVLRPEAQRALVIGGGSYSVPRALLSDLPQAQVEVAEIEPTLYGLSKQYFGLSDSPRLVNYVDDGRRMLRGKDAYYDVIFGDAYYSTSSIPQHMATQEFFEEARRALKPDGIFMANIIGRLDGERPSFTASEMATFQTVFPQNRFVAVNSAASTDVQNIMFIGFKGQVPDMKAMAGLIERQTIATERLDLASHEIFTDDFAPIDYYIATTVRLGS